MLKINTPSEKAEEPGRPTLVDAGRRMELDQLVARRQRQRQVLERLFCLRHLRKLTNNLQYGSNKSECAARGPTAVITVFTASSSLPTDHVFPFQIAQ